MSETVSVPTCSRYALLLGPNGRKRRMPVLDLMELKDTYQFNGDTFTVVSMFTQEDLPK